MKGAPQARHVGYSSYVLATTAVLMWPQVSSRTSCTVPVCACVDRDQFTWY